MPLGAHPSHIGVALLDRQCVLPDQRISHEIEITLDDDGWQTCLTNPVDTGVGLYPDQGLDTVAFELENLDGSDVELVFFGLSECL
jgi:hypothetical protein